MQLSLKDAESLKERLSQIPDPRMPRGKRHRKFIHLKSQKTTEETVYGITSLTPHKADPSRILQLNRGHWSIENSLHYVRDVTFREDHSSIRTNHAPRVMASLRNCIISIFRSLGKTAIAQTLRTMTYKPHLALKLLRL